MREHIQYVLRHLEKLATEGLLLKKSRRRGSLLDEVSEKMLKKIQRMSGKGGVAPQPTCMLEVSAHR